MVVLVFIGDWFTPAAVVIALGYEAPVLLAALKGTQRLTISTICLGSFGIALGWFVDLAQASFQYSDTRLANRIFSLISVWIVGYLALLIQRNAERMEAVGAQRALRRESALAAGMDRIIAALSPATTIRALIGEAPRMLEATAAAWCSLERGGASWIMLDGSSEPRALSVEPSATFDALLKEAQSHRSVEVVSAAESIDFLAGKSLGGKEALAIPIGDGSKIVGVVFTAVGAPRSDDRALVEAGNFAKFATTALHAKAAHHAPTAENGPG
jgi:hypothetical protein